MTTLLKTFRWPAVISTVMFLLFLAGDSSLTRGFSSGSPAEAESWPPFETMDLDSILRAHESRFESTDRSVDSVTDTSKLGPVTVEAGFNSVSTSRVTMTSIPFDPSAQERMRFLQEMRSQGQGLQRDLRAEIRSSGDQLENRLIDLLDSRVATLDQRISQNDVSTSTPKKISIPVGEKKLANADKVERMIYPIVQMKGNGTVGSGVVVSNELRPDGGWYTWIVTAYHVVEEVRDFSDMNSTLVKLYFFDPELNRLSETKHIGTEIVAFPESDLSLLRVERDTPWIHVATVASEEVCRSLTVFDQVYAVGCPLGNQPIPTRGEISSQYKEVGDEVYWMVSAPTFFGNSGGGIFRSGDGQLVGLSSMVYTYGKRSPLGVPHMGLFVPLSQVRSWLRREGYVHLLEAHEGVPVTASGDISAPSDQDSGSF